MMFHSVLRYLRLAFAVLLAAMGCASALSNAAPILEKISPNPTVYQESTDYSLFTTNSPGFFASFPGNVTAPLQLVAPDLDTGCQAADFAGFASGNIALIRRGGCFFSDKVNFAAAAGAVGVLIYNNLPGGVGSVTLEDPTNIPSMHITNVLGADLIAEFGSGRVIMHMSTVTESVPEPVTLSLLALSLAGLGWSRRRK
jgi:hypothetical protein